MKRLFEGSGWVAFASAVGCGSPEGEPGAGTGSSSSVTVGQPSGSGGVGEETMSNSDGAMSTTGGATGEEATRGTASSGGQSSEGSDDGRPSDPWAPVVAGLEASELTDFTLVVGDDQGIVFTHSKGDSSIDTPYFSASAAKWITGALVLDLVEDGELALGTRAADVLPWWDEDDPADSRSEVTLEQLLAFTSGFSGRVLQPQCILQGNIELEACAQDIYAGGLDYEPGSTFHYGPKHMQVAAAMVEAVEAVEGASYSEVFRARIGDPLGLQPVVQFDRPSMTNPRASAGMTVTADDYGVFLRAILTDALFDADALGFDLDRTPDGVTLAYSPVSGLEGQSWHYALGHWIECVAPFDAECASDPVLSSPGGAGFYPWMVPSKGYWGVLAREGSLGTMPPESYRSVLLMQSLRDDIEAALR